MTPPSRGITRSPPSTYKLSGQGGGAVKACAPPTRWSMSAETRRSTFSAHPNREGGVPSLVVRRGASRTADIETNHASEGEIYVDPSQPAILQGAIGSVDCPTLREAVIGWLQLSAEQKENTTIRVAERAYTAFEVGRLHYDPGAAGPETA
jgi:hypothetical protein